MYLEARLAKGERVVGYKVGCTSRAIREQFGLTEPICGRLMAPHVYRGDVTLSWNQFCRCAVEPELVMVMGTDLTARWTGYRPASKPTTTRSGPATPRCRS